MKNFDWTTFTRKIAIKAPLTDIYTAWTTTSAIEKWFLSKAVFMDTNGKPVNKATPIEKGFSYEWNWYLYDETEHGKITEANGKDFIQFTFAGECLVDIQLSTLDDYVIVEQHIRLGCHTGWSFYLVNLKSVYEGGLDLRNKETKLKVMMNN